MVPATLDRKHGEVNHTAMLHTRSDHTGDGNPPKWKVKPKNIYGIT